ncbi:MAG: PadR family transcriptional regulator [Defluviitaleaceae bacterium]|nr:PadR family transcriptional regulator [Defluviitaleaceae bacterium]
MSIQLKKGALQLCVLGLLSKRDMYGFELVGAISKHVKIAEGTIYPLLKRIKDEGCVTTYLKESQEGPPRKYYQITATGQRILLELLDEWSSLVAGVKNILEESQ